MLAICCYSFQFLPVVDLLGLVEKRPGGHRLTMQRNLFHAGRPAVRQHEIFLRDSEGFCLTPFTHSFLA